MEPPLVQWNAVRFHNSIQDTSNQAAQVLVPTLLSVQIKDKSLLWDTRLVVASRQELSPEAQSLAMYQTKSTLEYLKFNLLDTHMLISATQLAKALQEKRLTAKLRI